VLAFLSSQLGAVNCPKMTMAGWANCSSAIERTSPSEAAWCTQSHAASNPNPALEVTMAEATLTLAQAQLRTTLGAATITLARQAAIKATKYRLRALGLKPTHFSHREIVIRAEAYLAKHRTELMEEAKQTVERWAREGFFGKRARAAVHKTPEV
jgi:hypothetical protein